MLLIPMQQLQMHLFIALIALTTSVGAFPQDRWTQDFQSTNQEIKPGYVFSPETVRTVLRVQNPHPPVVVESTSDGKRPGIITSDGILFTRVQRNETKRNGIQRDEPLPTRSARLAQSVQPQQNATQPKSFNLLGDLLNGLGKGIEAAVGLIGFASPSLSFNAKTTGDGGTAKTQIDSKTSLFGFDMGTKDVISGGTAGIGHQSERQLGFLAEPIAKFNASNRLNLDGAAGQVGTDNCNEFDLLGNRIRDCSNRQIQINPNSFGQLFSGFNNVLGILGG